MLLRSITKKTQRYLSYSSNYWSHIITRLEIYLKTIRYYSIQTIVDNKCCTTIRTYSFWNFSGQLHSLWANLNMIKLVYFLFHNPLAALGQKNICWCWHRRKNKAKPKQLQHTATCRSSFFDDQNTWFMVSWNLKALLWIFSYVNHFLTPATRSPLQMNSFRRV